ncbi:MAG: glycoside hydrolase, partial [Ignavibacteriae bacterium]|nr:glycoside hydrolase [Ignavibacteriota bacterium]
MKIKSLFNVFIFVVFFVHTIIGQENILKINDQNYYELPSVNIMMFDDFYPDGHQGGLSIIQFGRRIATNGDVRLEPTPGQWSPVPAVGERKVNKENGIIAVQLWYPDSSKNRIGFNPINYPDLTFNYEVKTEAIGDKIKLTVNLEKPLPDEWADKVGFNFEIFPGYYFGEHYLMDGNSGIFPQQANGPMITDTEGNLQIKKLASGKKIIVSPGILEKQFKVETNTSELEFFDGRGLHNNGWFVLRSTITRGATKNAVEWIITPSYNTDWRYKPVVQVSQVGYHPKQIKFATVELDKLTDNFETIKLIRIKEDSEKVVKEEISPKAWGNFLRYKYLRFDFTDIKEEGLYLIKYGSVYS